MDIQEFVKAAEPQNREFVQTVHDELTALGYKIKSESKATGLFVTYSYPKTKRSFLNLFFRKAGMKARLYPLGVNKDIVDNLPCSMEKEVEKAMPCKRLINPSDCSPTCVKGYDFDLKGKRLQKCRFNCFEFFVTAESKPVMLKWIQSEAKQ